MSDHKVTSPCCCGAVPGQVAGYYIKEEENVYFFAFFIIERGHSGRLNPLAESISVSMGN